MTKREAYLSFKCWHCVFLETESRECLCGDPESDECPKPEYDGMTEVRNEIEKGRRAGITNENHRRSVRQLVDFSRMAKMIIKRRR